MDAPRAGFAVTPHWGAAHCGPAKPVPLRHWAEPSFNREKCCTLFRHG